MWYKRDLVKNIMSHLKTIFTKKEQKILKNMNINKVRNQTQTKAQNHPTTQREKNTQTNPKFQTKNTLKTIMESIIMNSAIQKAIGIYDIVLNYKNNIYKLGRIPKKCYKKVLEKLGGNSEEKKIDELRRSIMEKLPPNPNIENILDTRCKINKIKNTQDRESVVHYLSKS